VVFTNAAVISNLETEMIVVLQQMMTAKEKTNEVSERETTKEKGGKEEQHVEKLLAGAGETGGEGQRERKNNENV
jgi:hypothetical protein